MSDQTCIFCDIVDKKIPAFRIYEDERTLAFADINPATPGHTLVIVKQHHENLYSLTPGDVAAVHQTVLKVTKAIKATLKPEGIMVAQLNEPAAGQIIMHYHVHIIPRTSSDGLSEKMSWEMKPGDMGEIEKIAAAISEAL